METSHSIYLLFEKKLLFLLDFYANNRNKNFEVYTLGFVLLVLSLTFFWNINIKRIFSSKEENYMYSLKCCAKELSNIMISQNCYPILLRLAWSDAGTFDKTIKIWPHCGGANGSIRYDYELEHPSNSGLEKAIDYISPIKNKFKNISWADLIQMSGALAVELLGGPHIDMKYGRKDAPRAVQPSKQMRTHSNVPMTQHDVGVSQHSDNQTFLTSNTKTSRHPLGGAIQTHASRLPVSFPPYPDGAPSAEVHIRNIFYRMGLSNRDAVALIGAHTIGRAFKDRSGTCLFSSGQSTKYTRPTSIAKSNNEPGIGMPGGCSWTKNWLHFDNSYFKRITSSNEANDPELLWLPTDQALYDCPEFRPYFLKYSSDQSLFFHDYAIAHKKMSELGSSFTLFSGRDITIS